MTSADRIRILLLADTHLGFDLPARPRVARRFRGPEFLASFDRALRPALAGQVDLVVHGGDVFFRSRVRSGIVLDTVDRLRAVTEAGVPVLVVPGNHERSKLPCPLLWHVPGVYVFDRPRTHRFELRGMRVALTGFPYSRERLSTALPGLLEAADWNGHPTDLRLLCMHHIVEGAVVGPGDFTFRHGRDVVPGRLIPGQFAAVLSGHIHRAQIRRRDLRGYPLACPVIYPGSTSRTSFAEQDERKGYMIVEAAPGPDDRGRITRCAWRDLPVRPMVQLDLDLERRRPGDIAGWLRRRIAGLDPNSIVQLRVHGDTGRELPETLRAAALRALAPSTMNLDLTWRRTGAIRPGRNRAPGV